jgi:hypothetical protein
MRKSTKTGRIAQMGNKSYLGGESILLHFWAPLAISRTQGPSRDHFYTVIGLSKVRIKAGKIER